MVAGLRVGAQVGLASGQGQCATEERRHSIAQRELKAVSKAMAEKPASRSQGDHWLIGSNFCEVNAACKFMIDLMASAAPMKSFHFSVTAGGHGEVRTLHQLLVRAGVPLGQPGVLKPRPG